MVANKLIIVTGCPGSGKSTLAPRLASGLGHSLLSRDEVKETLLDDRGMSHAEAGDDINQIATRHFFSHLEKMMTVDSLIAEAAFQDSLWRSFLATGSWAARVIVCHASPEVAFARFKARRSTQRVYFHGDDLVASEALIRNYQAPLLDVPTLLVDTHQGYSPCLEEILEFCLG